MPIKLLELQPGAECGDGSKEITVWDLMYEGSPCSISLGPLTSDLSNTTLYACTATLYGKNCTGMKDSLNLLFYYQQPTAAVVLQISNHLATLGISELTQVASLKVLMVGSPPSPIQPSFLRSLAFISGDLVVTGVPALVRTR
jgi:hypothetical protein